VSEDTGGRRRAGAEGAGRSDDTRAASRPVTAAGRRRRGAADDDGEGPRSAGVATRDKGAPTPSRDSREAPSEGSVIARLRRFLREVVAELRKVHWPTRRQIVVYTVVVLVFVAFMVTLVGLLDVGFQKLTFALFG
jgi:preprotein translocase subunit SecE